MKNLSELENGQNILNENATKIIELLKRQEIDVNEDPKNLNLVLESYLFLIDYYLHNQNVDESQFQLNFCLKYTKRLGKYSMLKLKVFEKAAEFYGKKNLEIRKDYFSNEANKIRAKLFGNEEEK